MKKCIILTWRHNRRKQLSFALYLMLLAIMVMSCGKEQAPPPPPGRPMYHLSIKDHSTGEKVSGLQGEVGGLKEGVFGDYLFASVLSVKADAQGSFHFRSAAGMTHFRINDTRFRDVVYRLSPPYSNAGIAHEWLEADGGNVIFCQFLKQEGNDYYFQGDLYNKAYVDLHIIQESKLPMDIGDTLYLTGGITSTDPANAKNVFQYPHALESIAWASRGAHLDTTIRLYGQAGYLNQLNWSAFGISHIAADSLNQEEWTDLSSGRMNWTGQGPDTVTRLELRF